MELTGQGTALMQEQFTARATELGASVHLAENLQEAVSGVAELFQSANASTVVLARDLGHYMEPLRAALGQAGARFVESAEVRDVALAGVGVIRGVLAVAETGSVVLAGNETQPKLAAMLPPFSIVLIEASALVASLDEAGEYLRRAATADGEEMVRYVSFVSGPSRTSDVEKTLTIGVHGPGQLHIVIVQ